jgi:predicted GIY-YIG superfamily endonuclease
VDWIRRQPERKTTARAILRAHVGGVRNAGEAKALLKRLVEHGYGTLSEVTRTHGQPSLIFILTAKEPARTTDTNATRDNMASGQKGRAA